MDKGSGKVYFYRNIATLFTILFFGAVIVNSTFAWTNPSSAPPSGNVGAIPIGIGGIGATSAAAARSALGAAESGATTIDWNKGNVQRVVLGAASIALTFNNYQSGGRYILLVAQDTTGSRLAT